jgi:hypothetical protein
MHAPVDEILVASIPVLACSVFPKRRCVTHLFQETITDLWENKDILKERLDGIYKQNETVFNFVSWLM